MADQCRQVSVYYGTKALGWNPRFLHSFEPKALSGREREGKTDKRSTVCVDGSPKIDPSSCRVDQMRTIHGGVFRLINSTLHSVFSKVTGKLVVSLHPSSNPFVKSHSSPSSFTLCNIFWGISLPKTEQKDHFSCQFFKFSNSQNDGCDGIM